MSVRVGRPTSAVDVGFEFDLGAERAVADEIGHGDAEVSGHFSTTE